MTLQLKSELTVLTQQYDPRVRDALSRVPEGGWKEFSAFSGPRLERLVGWGKVALLGDASHPLSGKSIHISIYCIGLRATNLIY